MTMTSARLWLPMSDPTYRGSELEQLSQVARFHHQLGCEYLVLAAGAERSGEALTYLAGMLNEAGSLCAAEGVKLAYHPKIGTTVQDADDLARLVETTDPASVWLAPDTGQWHAGGIDITSAFATYASRIGYVHASDVDRDGQPRPLGAGVVDFRALRNVLDETDYAGWVIAEDRSDEVKVVGASESARGSSLFLQRVLAAAADGRCAATLTVL
jgi:sugar phosphate isomerase/epimerase